MKYRSVLLLSSLIISPSSFGSDVKAPQQQNIYSKDKRAQDLSAAKKQMDDATLKKLTKRSEGRKAQKIGGDILDATKVVDDLLFNAPLSIKQHYATTAVAVLNTVVTGIGLGIRAYGRRKEAMQSIVSANEQILEAASRSFEKVEALNTELEALLGPKTIAIAIEKNQDPTLSKSQKLINLLAPRNYINTFNKFTDALYITDNKAERWEKIKKITKDLQEEQARYDDYIALLQIKFLEKMVMTFHLEENKYENLAAKGKSENPGGYIKKLEDSIEPLTEAIKITEQKIADLKEAPAAKDGLLNRLKKTVGKDDGTKRAKILKSLEEERDNYVKQKESVMDDIEYYKNSKTDSNAIKTGRDELLKKIADIKGRKAQKISIEDLQNTIEDLRNQILKLQNKNAPTGDVIKDLGALRGQLQILQSDVDRLKASRNPVQPYKATR